MYIYIVCKTEWNTLIYFYMVSMHFIAFSEAFFRVFVCSADIRLFQVFLRHNFLSRHPKLKTEMGWESKVLSFSYEHKLCMYHTHTHTHIARLCICVCMSAHEHVCMWSLFTLNAQQSSVCSVHKFCDPVPRTRTARPAAVAGQKSCKTNFLA